MGEQASMLELIASVNQSAETWMPESSRPRIRSRSVTASEILPTAHESWSCEGQAEAKPRKHSLPTMPPMFGQVDTPPSTPPNMPHQPYNTHHQLAANGSSPVPSIEEDQRPCRHCECSAESASKPTKAEITREQKYKQILQSNHELRRMLDISTKQMSIIFEQFRREQETSEESTRRMSDLEAALEEAQARQIDLMEQNHVLRANSFSLTSDEALFACSQPMSRKPSSPIDRQLEQFQFEEPEQSRAELEEQIKHLVATVESQNAEISQLKTQINETAEARIEFNYLTAQLGGTLPHGRRGAVSVTPDSYLGRIIDEINSAQSSPMISPRTAPAVPTSVHQLRSADAQDSDEEEPTNALRIHYTPPSAPSSPVSASAKSPRRRSAIPRSHPVQQSRTPSPRSLSSTSSSIPLKPAKRLPHPQSSPKTHRQNSRSSHLHA